MTKFKKILTRVLSLDFGNDSINKNMSSIFFTISCLSLLVALFHTHDSITFKCAEELKVIFLLFAYATRCNVGD